MGGLLPRKEEDFSVGDRLCSHLGKRSCTIDNRATGGEMPPSDRRFDENSFWAKLKKQPQNISKPILENALVLYFCLKDPQTPFQIKGAIIAVLAYFVMPLDVVADFLPVVGYGDDFSALVIAIGTFFQHIKPEHRTAAKDKLDKWFAQDKSAGLKQQELQQYLQVLLVALLKVEYALDTDIKNLKVIIDFTRREIQKIMMPESNGPDQVEIEIRLNSAYQGAIKILKKENKAAARQLPRHCPWEISFILGRA
jgi:uncharacterized membrane protein YkvA (DUF1232 family)